MNDPFPVYPEGLYRLPQNVHSSVLPQRLPHIAAQLTAPGVRIPPLADSREAAPSPVESPVSAISFSGHKTGAALPALDFPAEHIAVGMAAPLWSVDVPLLQFLLDRIPQLPVNDRLVVVPDDHQRLLTVIVFLGVRQVVRCKGFLLYKISNVLLVFQDLDDVAAAPFWISPAGQNPRLPKLSRNDRGPLLLHSVFVKDQPYYLRPLRFYCNVSSLYIVSEQGPSEYNSTLHLPGLAPFHPGGGLAALLLGDGAHDAEPQFRIGF